MFAVVKTGGKQYKVSPGDLLTVERLEGEAGQSVLLTSVLLINNEGQITTGIPFLDQAQVRAAIVEQSRGDKIIVFKKRRRQGYRRKAGHRQDLTVLRIEEISASGQTFGAVKAAPPKSKKMNVTEIVSYAQEVSASSEEKKEKKTKTVKKTEGLENAMASGPEKVKESSPKKSVVKDSAKEPKKEPTKVSSKKSKPESL